MDGGQLTRRQVLVGAIAGMTTVRAAFEKAHGGTAPGVPAAAAGSITLGGDLTVNRMGFGAMRITGEGIWGEPKDPAECRRVLRRALELGVNFIDTADSYGPEVSERLIAAALYPYPPQLVIATKGGLTRPGPNSWVPDGRPEHLRAACEGSLARLKLERIDLYQFHAVDRRVPLEDSMGALAQLRRQGKIRHVGVSNFSAGQLERARRIVPVVSVQNRYNLTDRDSEEVLGVCTREGLAFIPWAPLARGAASAPDARRALEAAAEAHRVSVFEVAIAWLLAKSPAVLPIPGTSSVAHLEDNVAAAGLKLSRAELAALG